MTVLKGSSAFPEGSPFKGRIVFFRDGSSVRIEDGDFKVMLPSNQMRWIKLRTGLPLFPITSPEGEAPAEYVIRKLEVNSVSTAHFVYENSLRRFCKYLMEKGWKTFGWYDVDEPTLLSYLSYLRTSSREFEFSGIRQFYLWAVDAGYHGFDPEIAQKLSALRIKGAPKGIDVLTGDPVKGPLRDEVFRRLLLDLSTSDGPILQRVCLSLSLELGANVAQYCQLRKRDFVVYELTDSADPIYHLNLPRSKKGDSYVGRRRRPLSPRLGRLLQEYVSATVGERDGLGMDDPYLLLTEAGKPMTGAAFYWLLRSFPEGYGIERVLQGYLGPRRLRKTLATRLVEEGASEEHVMDALDHTDAQNVGVYFEMRDGSFSRIDDAVGSTLDPVAKRFMGRIVNSEADASLGDRPEQRVKASLGVANVGIGTCGRDIRVEGLCQLHPPYACYSCPRFQPWRDADHRGFAERLRKDRDEIAALEGGDEGGRVVGQLDHLIAAAREVAKACEKPPPEPERRKRRRRDGGGES